MKTVIKRKNIREWGGQLYVYAEEMPGWQSLQIDIYRFWENENERHTSTRHAMEHTRLRRTDMCQIWKKNRVCKSIFIDFVYVEDVIKRSTFTRKRLLYTRNRDHRSLLLPIKYIDTLFKIPIVMVWNGLQGIETMPGDAACRVLRQAASLAAAATCLYRL